MRQLLCTTRKGRALSLATVAVALGGVAFAAPASAVPLVGGDTTVTFTVGVVGGVSILPAPVAVGLPSGDAVTGTIASVVTDLRIAGGSWTNTVSSTDFALVGATAAAGDALIPASSAKMWTTQATVAIPGTATIENLYTSADDALTLSTAGAELVSATTSNINVTALLSSFSIDVSDKAMGAYVGTITQTVS
jgi:hypothetical protein